MSEITEVDETKGKTKHFEASVDLHSGTMGRHLKTHSGEKLYKCNQCSYSFSKTSSLNDHL